MHKSSIVLTLVAIPCLAVLATACSYLWSYDYDVSVSEDVDLTEGATLIMAQAVESGGITEVEGTTEATVIADTRAYTGEGSVCCSPAETVSLYAFLDLDGSGTWDPGEPWGEDPNNPVTIEDDNYVSTIVVEPDAG